MSRSSNNAFLAPFDPEQFREYLRDLLPMPGQFFAYEFLAKPMFEISVLLDVAILYVFEEKYTPLSIFIAAKGIDKKKNRLFRGFSPLFYDVSYSKICKNCLRKAKSYSGHSKSVYESFKFDHCQCGEDKYRKLSGCSADLTQCLEVKRRRPHRNGSLDTSSYSN